MRFTVDKQKISEVPHPVSLKEIADCVLILIDGIEVAQIDSFGIYLTHIDNRIGLPTTKGRIRCRDLFNKDLM